MKKERLDKLLSNNSLGTRREVQKLIAQGLISVNGMVEKDSSRKLDSEKDVIEVSGKVINIEKDVYLMMNKKRGVVSAKTDERNETVFSSLSKNYRTPYMLKTLHIVGRLDIDSEGLLILTTDGKLTHKIISPERKCEKRYFVRLKESVPLEKQKEITEIFRSGVEVKREGREKGFLSQSAKLAWESENSAIITLTEGKFHEIKRLFKEVGNEVIELKRIGIGRLNLDRKLGPGEYRPLKKSEVEALI